MSGALSKAQANPRALAEEREPGAPAAARSRAHQRLDPDVLESVLRERRRDLLAFPCAVLRKRHVLQLTAAAGAKMGARRLIPRRPLEPLDGVADQTVAASPADAHAQAIARHGEGHEDLAGIDPGHAVAARADRLDHDLMLCAGHREVRHLLGADAQQAEALPGHGIDHGEKLLARLVAAEQNETAAIDHHLLDPRAGRQQQRLRRPLRDRSIGASAQRDQHRKQYRAGDQRDATGDDKELESARNVVHASRRA